MPAVVVAGSAGSDGSGLPAKRSLLADFWIGSARGAGREFSSVVSLFEVGRAAHPGTERVRTTVGTEVVAAMVHFAVLRVWAPTIRRRFLASNGSNVDQHEDSANPTRQMAEVAEWRRLATSPRRHELLGRGRRDA